MIRRPPRSTQGVSSAASDVYKRQMQNIEIIKTDLENELLYLKGSIPGSKNAEILVKGSVKNISKLTMSEKIKKAEEAKKTPDKKKKQ